MTDSRYRAGDFLMAAVAGATGASNASTSRRDSSAVNRITPSSRIKVSAAFRAWAMTKLATDSPATAAPRSISTLSARVTLATKRSSLVRAGRFAGDAARDIEGLYPQMAHTASGNRLKCGIGMPLPGPRVSRLASHDL